MLRSALAIYRVFFVEDDLWRGITQIEIISQSVGGIGWKISIDFDTLTHIFLFDLNISYCYLKKVEPNRLVTSQLANHVVE